LCGLLGAVVIEPGKKWNAGIIRALTWANRERGTDSLGFFDSSGKMTKGAGDPCDVLRKNRVQKWLQHSQDTAWFVAGHTRLATRGKVNRRNSHPFRYGRIIGSHNGMCDAPQKFKVDSEYLFYALNKARGDYQTGLGDISGYFGLSWYDGEDFYLLSHSGELAYEIIGGVLYYSSSWSHLDSCTGGNSRVLTEGQVIRISPDGTIADSTVESSPIEKFTSTAYSQYGRSGGRNWNYYDDTYITSYSSGRGGAGRKEATTWQNADYLDDNGNVTDATARDYDGEWQDAWADYCTQSEHSNTGFETEEELAGRYAG
jgi:hypothetical protein